MLRLETEGPTMDVSRPAFALDGPVQEISGIELQPGLIREDVEGPPRRRLHYAGGMRQSRAPVQHEVVVIPTGNLELGIGVADPCPDGVPLPEIEGCTGHGSDGPGGDEGRVNRGVTRRVDGDDVSDNIGCAARREIEVRVLAQ